MFDEEPDRDPHGECRAETARLTAELAAARQIADARREWLGTGDAAKSPPRTDTGAIAADMLACAEAWAPGAMLMGNVRADEIAAVCRELAAARAVPADVEAAIDAYEARVTSLVTSMTGRAADDAAAVDVARNNLRAAIAADKAALDDTWRAHDLERDAEVAQAQAATHEACAALQAICAALHVTPPTGSTYCAEAVAMVVERVAADKARAVEARAESAAIKDAVDAVGRLGIRMSGDDLRRSIEAIAAVNPPSLVAMAPAANGLRPVLSQADAAKLIDAYGVDAALHGALGATGDARAALLAALTGADAPNPWAAANPPPPDHRDTMPPEIEAAIADAGQALVDAWDSAQDGPPHRFVVFVDPEGDPEVAAGWMAMACMHAAALAAARDAGRREVAPLRRENEVLRSNSDHLSSENASLASQVESMALRIESLAEELAKPEDVRLREVLDALDGRAVIFDGLGARVGHLLDEMDEWIERAGVAERRLKKAEEVVMLARQLTAYSWEDRLEDCKVSDEAKHDSRELSTAVWLYDQEAKS